MRWKCKEQNFYFSNQKQVFSRDKNIYIKFRDSTLLLPENVSFLYNLSRKLVCTVAQDAWMSEEAVDVSWEYLLSAYCCDHCKDIASHGLSFLTDVKENHKLWFSGYSSLNLLLLTYSLQASPVLKMQAATHCTWWEHWLVRHLGYSSRKCTILCMGECRHSNLLPLKLRNRILQFGGIRWKIKLMPCMQKKWTWDRRWTLSLFLLVITFYVINNMPDCGSD